MLNIIVMTWSSFQLHCLPTFWTWSLSQEVTCIISFPELISVNFSIHVFYYNLYIISEKLLFSDPLFRDFWKFCYKSRSELYDIAVAKGVKINSLRKKYRWTDEQFDVAQGYVCIRSTFSLTLSGQSWTALNFTTTN